MVVQHLRKQKILDLDSLKACRESHRKSCIVHCHGVFDVLHAGHLAYFESAKKLGDLLVVSLTADEFVNKGPGRPYFPSMVRANMIAALEVVDHVVISKFPTAINVIQALRPDYYVKGPDYQDKSRDITGGIYAEESAVQAHGGQLVFTEDTVFSSSSLINKFFTTWSESQQETIEKVRSSGGVEKVEEILERVSKETVSVAGESIVDTYVFCSPEALSSKSPSISAKFLYEENYLGGAVAIANHLADFAKEVGLCTTTGGEKYFHDLLDAKLDPRVDLNVVTLANIPTPRKTRYIESYKSQRMFELTDLRSDQWLHHSPDGFCEMLRKKSAGKGVTIIADFGHGLFEQQVLETVGGLDGFVALNVQTNSSNFGFNPFSKHRKFSFLSIDAKEASIAYHDRLSPRLTLAKRVYQTLSDRSGPKASFVMTLGADGAYYFTNRSPDENYAPAFADRVVDPTGAGDAFFALTALLVKVDCPEIFVPFLGNVFAGLKAKIIGNKASVSKAQLLKAVTSILK